MGKKVGKAMEGDGDGCWSGRETEEMGNHGFVGEAEIDGCRWRLLVCPKGRRLASSREQN
jgi:hypothetical protein